MNSLSTPVKSVFGKAALRMLNACARFAYNLAPGFGIRFARLSGSAAIAIDTENKHFQEWIKDQAHSHKATDKTDTLVSGYEERAFSSPSEVLDDGTWKRGGNDLEIYCLCRQVDNGIEGPLMFRKVKIDRHGHVASIGGEDDGHENGWAVTDVP